MKYLIVQNKYHYTKKYLYLVELRLIYFVLAGAFQPYLGWKVVRCFKAAYLGTYFAHHHQSGLCFQAFQAYFVQLEPFERERERDSPGDS